MDILELLNNVWTVTIIGGIIVAVLLYWLKNSLFPRKQKEYRQRIQAANQEIITSLRSSISENSIPSIEIFEALISSTARRHNVFKDDVYSISEFAEELTKEIMDTSFLDLEIKHVYHSLLHPYLNAPHKPEDSISLQELEIQQRKKESITLYFSTCISIAIFTIMYVYFKLNNTTYSATSLMAMVVLIQATCILGAVYLVNESRRFLDLNKYYMGLKSKNHAENLENALPPDDTKQSN